MLGNVVKMHEPWQIIKGDDSALRIKCTTDNEPTNLEGLYIYAFWKKSSADTRKIGLQVDLIDLKNGMFAVKIRAAQTQDGIISSGIFTIKFLNGDQTGTLLSGCITLLGE